MLAPIALAAILVVPTIGRATVIADPELLDEATYPVGSIINEAFEGLTLSSYGSPAPYYSFPGNVLRYAHGGAVVTHTLGYDKIYNYFSPSYSTSDTWGGTFWGRLVLRVDLDQPASAVFADVIAFGASSDLMQLTAYDASGGQLGITYHQDFPYGLPPTRVEYSQAASTIAYFTVTDNHVVPFGFVLDKVGVFSSQVADFDGDGDVDGRDFLDWQRNPSIGSLADWQANYGTPALLSVNGAAIPEPATVLLLLAAIAIASFQGHVSRRIL